MLAQGREKRVIGAVVVTVLALTLVFNNIASAAVQTITVLPSNLQGWTQQNQSTGQTVFVDGKAPTGFGSSSLQMKSGPGNANNTPPIPKGGKAFIYNDSYVGKKLSDITALSYWTYVESSRSTVLAPAIDLIVTDTGDGANNFGFSTFVYEPIYSTQNNLIPTGQWQNWDTLQGKWWSTKDVPGFCASNCFMTWDFIKTNFPNATIIGDSDENHYGVIAVVGEKSFDTGWADFVGYVDGFTIGLTGEDTKVFDFEKHAYPNCFVNKNGSADYTTISDAVADTSCTTITVAAGTYAEHVNINRALTLKGANAGTDGAATRNAESVIDATNNGDAVYLAAAGITVDGFKIKNADGASGAQGVNVQADNSTITNNIIESNVIGIYLGHDNTKITHNLIRNNTLDGPAGGSGIYSDASTNPLIDHNTFSGNPNGPITLAAVALDTQVNPQITNNTITEINLVTLVGVKNGNISGNKFTSTAEYSAIGVDGGVNGLTVTGNQLIGGSKGININQAYIAGVNQDIHIHFNQIVNQTQFSIYVDNAADYSGQVDAENNWYGCDAGPNTAPCLPTQGAVDYNPWLKLTIKQQQPDPGPHITALGSVTVTATLTINSDGVDTSSLGHVPDGIAVLFSATAGSVSPQTTSTSNGNAVTTYTPTDPQHPGGVTATIDKQTDNKPDVGCGAQDVTKTTDDGSCGTLRYAVANADIAQPITIDLASGSSIALTSTLTINKALTITTSAGCTDGPAIYIVGSGVANLGNVDGLVISGGVHLQNVWVSEFGGRQIVASGGQNVFLCVKASKDLPQG